MTMFIGLAELHVVKTGKAAVALNVTSKVALHHTLTSSNSFLAGRGHALVFFEYWHKAGAGF